VAHAHQVLNLLYVTLWPRGGYCSQGVLHIDELTDHGRYKHARGWDVVCGLIYWIAGRTRGQGMVEYALIFALIVVVVVGTLILFGPQMSSIYKNIENAL
jgi:pilus assembly protein Flp/PilA